MLVTMKPTRGNSSPWWCSTLATIRLGVVTHRSSPRDWPLCRFLCRCAPRAEPLEPAPHRSGGSSVRASESEARSIHRERTSEMFSGIERTRLQDDSHRACFLRGLEKPKCWIAVLRFLFTRKVSALTRHTGIGHALCVALGSMIHEGRRSRAAGGLAIVLITQKRAGEQARFAPRRCF